MNGQLTAWYDDGYRAVTRWLPVYRHNVLYIMLYYILLLLSLSELYILAPICMQHALYVYVGCSTIYYTHRPQTRLSKNEPRYTYLYYIQVRTKTCIHARRVRLFTFVHCTWLFFGFYRRFFILPIFWFDFCRLP